MRILFFLVALLWVGAAHAQTKPTCPAGASLLSWSCMSYVTGSAINPALGTDLVYGTRPTNSALTFGPISVSQLLAALTAAQVNTALGYVPLSTAMTPAGVTTTPALALNNLSAQSKAPRSPIMTASFATATNTGWSTFQAGSLTTYQEVMPLSTNFYAIRVGQMHPWKGTRPIASMSVYPSDSYSGYVANGNITTGTPANGSTSNINTIPTINSVYQVCTVTNGSATLTCPNTAVLPSASTMYAIGIQQAGTSIVTATVASGTTLTLSGAATNASGSLTVQFANLAPECKLYFDYSGAAVDNVNLNGTNRAITIAGNPTVAQGTNTIPFTLFWTDFVPCSPLARADGGANPLVFIYITNAASTVGFGYSVNGLNSYNSGAAQTVLNNRYSFQGRPWAGGGTDYSDNPAGTGFTNNALNTPAIMVQYLTTQPGFNVVTAGDSLSVAPPDDGYSTETMRACYLLSTPQLPCEWSSVAQGGAQSTTYDESLRQNLSALHPSAIVIQAGTRNDGITSLILQWLVDKAFNYTAKSTARLGFLGFFPLTSTLDGNVPYQTAVAAQRALLNSISKTCQPSTGGQDCPQIPVLDPTPIVSRLALGGPAWDYLGLLNPANGATAAGSTTINVTPVGGVISAYVGDVLTDPTTPGALASTCTVLGATLTTITVANTCVIGSGVQNGDQLVSSYPGWTGGNLSNDNTHPWYPAMLLVQSAATTFMKQLLGLQ